MVSVAIEHKQLRELRNHLLGDRSREQAAFLFCKERFDDVGNCTFACSHWTKLDVCDFEHQKSDYLELTDAARARLIKSAHDGHFCLVESHSHPGPYQAAFSSSDLSGLAEFVPHVRWRLGGRPYGALVFADSGFDGLAWLGASKAPQQIARITTEKQALSSTGLTLTRRSNHESF